MELTKQPVTEMEYWEAIEGLGGFIWSTNHGLAKGHIEDSTGGVDKDVISAREIQQKLAKELEEKFNVILPADCPKVELGAEAPPAPEGKIYYWDWYTKMKKENYGAEYIGMICSACPFSKGLDYMIQMGGQVPCGLISGWINRLIKPYICGMLNVGDWTEEKLFAKIVADHGEKALEAFEKKLEELKNKQEEVV